MSPFTHTTLLIAAFLVIHAAASPEPLQQPWSSKTYGPDGPWNAVTVQINGTNVDLTPGGTFQTWALADVFCSNKSLFTSHTCDAMGAGLVQTPPLNYFDTLPGFQPNGYWVESQPANGTPSILYPLPVTIPVANPLTIPHVSVGLVNSSWVTLSDGTTYPQTLGQYALGGPAFNQSFGSINYTLLPSYLYQSGTTPSASYGIHIGSGNLGLGGSLYYGGYDRSRVLGDVLSHVIYESGSFPPYTGIGLLDIGIGTAIGGSPFSFANKTGLLAQGNSSMPNSLLVDFSTASPYLYLPKSTCDAIASNLPVTFQQKYDLYFWNTQDPNYARIVNSASYLYFEFEADNLPSRNLTIKIPWQLLNLTLSEPITNTPTPYFPCRPSDTAITGAYILGQAFMQAAFLAIDWKPAAPPGNWFLAQAPGPNTATVPDLQPMANGVSSISESTVKWEDTWTNHWTPISSNNDSSSTAPSSGTSSSAAPVADQQGLTSGAKAGIGVGCAAAGLLAIGALAFFLRKRRNAKKEEIAVGPRPELSKLDKGVIGLPAPPSYNAANTPFPPQEMYAMGNEVAGSHPVFELYDERPPHELGVAQ